jgi:polysaccharide chain length determinant protein (PEP-CTERM system associated)
MATSEFGRDYFSQVKEMTALLNQARLEQREAEQARDSLKREITSAEPGVTSAEPGPSPDVVPEAAMSVAVPEIDSRIEPLKRNLDGLMQRFTEQHPDVVNTKRQIKELETQKAEIVAARAKAARSQRPPSSESRNPVYQQLKVALAEAEGTVASLRARVTEYEARYARLKESSKSIPQMEAEFAQLNRDYDVNKKNYEGLVSRREVAEISGEMEAVSGAEFRLIDPPRVSPRPVAPDRMLLLLGAFLGALAGGIFASFAASQVWPTFTDVRMLREVTGLPVLGSVSMIVGEARKRKERHALIGFLSGLVTLLGSFGAGLLGLLLLSARAA